LLLVPVAVLIVLMLAVLTIDGGRALLVQRRSAGEAAAIANDLAALGLDRSAFQQEGALRLLPEGELIARAAALPRDGDLTVRRIDDRTVEVRVSRSVTPWLGNGSLPGWGVLEVGATARGVLRSPND
jgi:hypothetical protein